ncbi:MAG: divergent polysaccharide deacetylase family protein [Candidatus Tyrphobacter sp.]
MKPSLPGSLRLLAVLVAGASLFWLLGCQSGRQRERVHVAPRVAPQRAHSPAPLLAPAPAATVLKALQPAARGRARLAIIIDDCGQWLHTERGFIALPIPLTLSVLPDVRYGSLIASEATAAGKGVMLHLPMETISGLNPGPGKVTTEMSDAQITSQVDADLAQVPLAQGVNNHEGSKATADARVMRDVAQALKKHGDLFFVDSMTIGDSVAAAQARDAGLPTASRDVFLDNRANVAYTESQLQQAAGVALARGSAIAIGHPRPTTLAALRAMIPTLRREGVAFVLVSSLVQAPAQPAPEVPR